MSILVGILPLVVAFFAGAFITYTAIFSANICNLPGQETQLEEELRECRTFQEKLINATEIQDIQNRQLKNQLEVCRELNGAGE